MSKDAKNLQIVILFYLKGKQKAFTLAKTLLKTWKSVHIAGQTVQGSNISS